MRSLLTVVIMPTPFAKKPGARRRKNPARPHVRPASHDTPDDMGALPAKKPGDRQRGGTTGAGRASQPREISREAPDAARSCRRKAAAGGTRRVAKRGFSPFPYSPGRAARLAARNSHWLRHWAGTARHYAASGNACECQSPARGVSAPSGRSRTGSTCPSLPSRDRPADAGRERF